MNARDIQVEVAKEIPDLDATGQEILCRGFTALNNVIGQLPDLGGIGKLLFPKTARLISEIRTALAEYVRVNCG